MAKEKSNWSAILKVTDTKTKVLALICLVLEGGLLASLPLLPEADRLSAYIACTIVLFIMVLGIFIVEKRANVIAEATDSRTFDSNQKMKFFDLRNDVGKLDFFETLIQSIENSDHEIFRSGRGFSEIKKSESSFISRLIRAERNALNKQVKIYRLQTCNQTLSEWSMEYASLMEDFPGLLNVYSYYSNPSLVNVGIIDPRGDNPVIQLLFESYVPTPSADRSHHESTAALFIYGKKDLARALRAQFVQTIEENVKKLSPLELKGLGYHNYYFAYGSNLSFKQMRNRCPSAEKIGVGVLYGWKLEFSVYAQHYDALVAGIRETKNNKDYVWGVVYSLSSDDKRKLSDIETGGYVEKTVNVKFENSQDHRDVSTYVPVLETITNENNNSNIAEKYLNLMIEGAVEHEMSDLKKYLLEIKKKASTEQSIV